MHDYYVFVQTYIWQGRNLSLSFQYLFSRPGFAQLRRRWHFERFISSENLCTFRMMNNEEEEEEKRKLLENYLLYVINFRHGDRILYHEIWKLCYIF